MQIVDVAWDYDWLKVIDALTLARTCDDTNQAVLDKLYVAYYNYGQLLLTQGNKVEAAKQFRSALSVKSTGSEAQLALAQLTPTPSPSPTRRPVPPTATPTRAAYALVTMLNGSGNADTQHITIPQGSVRVVVNYSDAPRTGTVSQAEVDYHNQVLRIWDNWYQTALAPLTFALEDAVRANDAVAVVRVTRQMNELKAQYSREVNSENQRYADAVARARSQTTPTDIKVWSNQVSTNSSDLLGGWTGSGTQDMFFFSTGGNDYYFRVQATGSWSLTVYQKP